ncbi:MAG: stress response translation initiation inhibitor YciH [Thermoprotei archaeon]|nr:MAG: stress response translation initiation inhibitor YciH [Thermoprotei archaeon]RLF18804.1 MAG: stress response translation initiation inhibitor YciH [Thermoprotei archaeon]
MEGEIVPIRGLPSEIFEFEEMAKEQQQIRVRVEKRRFGREVTIIEGIDDKEINLKKIAKILKGKLACGGTVKNGRIELQGDHRARVKELLVKELGFSEDQIFIEE